MYCNLLFPDDLGLGITVVCFGWGVVGLFWFWWLCCSVVCGVGCCLVFGFCVGC